MPQSAMKQLDRNNITTDISSLDMDHEDDIIDSELVESQVNSLLNRIEKKQAALKKSYCYAKIEKSREIAKKERESLEGYAQGKQRREVYEKGFLKFYKQNKDNSTFLTEDTRTIEALNTSGEVQPFSYAD